jgi:hypothetical protein
VSCTVAARRPPGQTCPVAFEKRRNTTRLIDPGDDRPSLSALRLCARAAPACPGERFGDKAAGHHQSSDIALANVSGGPVGRVIERMAIVHVYEGR